MARCKAQSKQTGEQCKNHATPGHVVCRFHGSRAGRRPSTCRYARVVENDPELSRNFEDMLEDPTADDFDLSPEITLMRARLGAAIEKGTVDIKVINQIHNDLVKAVQKNTELQIKRQALVQRSDAEAILRAAIRSIVPFIPETMRAQAFEEVARVLGVVGATDSGPALRSAEVIDAEYDALPAKRSR